MPTRQAALVAVAMAPLLRAGKTEAAGTPPLLRAVTSEAASARATTGPS